MRSRRLMGAVVLLGLFSGAPSAMAQEDEQQAHQGWFEAASRIINFAVLAGALVYLLRRPLGNYLDARTEQIRRQLAEAAEKRERARAEREAAEARLSRLDEEIAEVRARAQAEAEAERDRILKAAADEAARLSETARREISAELELARRKLMTRATEIAVELARKKIAEEMTDADQKALIDRSIATLKEAR